jgi:hypothetical protein
MTARFWLPIIFGLGKVALLVILVLVVLVAVADTDQKTQLEGTYFVPLTSGDIQGNTYEAVDFLSVIQSHNGYQVDVLTNFFNGHICSFSGVMQRVLENRLVFDGTRKFPTEDCILGITWGETEIVLDANGCRDRCGARGGFMGATFPLGSRNNPPMKGLTDDELCNRVIGPDATIKDFTEVEQVVLYARGVDLWDCRK